MKRSMFLASFVGGLAILSALAIVAAGPRRSQARQVQPEVRELPELRKLLLDMPEVDLKKVVESLPDAKASATRQKEIVDEMMRLSVLELLEPPSPSGARGTFGAPLMNYLEWSERRLRTNTALAEGDEAKARLVAAEISRFRDLEALYQNLVKAGRVSATPRNVMELEFRRIDLENHLREMTASRP